MDVHAFVFNYYYNSCISLSPYFSEVIIDSVEESVPEQCLADDRSALVLRCGTMEQRGRDMEEISVMPRQPLPLPMPLPVPDSEPHPKPSGW